MEANKKDMKRRINLNLNRSKSNQFSTRMRKRHGKFTWEYNYFPKLVLVLKNCLVLTKILRGGGIRGMSVSP